MFNGKMKALTFSYDDGVTQDERLVEIFNKYNLKATFNLNSALLGMTGELKLDNKYVSHNKIKSDMVRSLYSGHEVAVHTLTHPDLTQLSCDAVVQQIENDRKCLEDLVGYDVVGMAYPGGCNNDEVADIIKKHTKIQYARTITLTNGFDLQNNLYRFNPSAFHKNIDGLFEMAKRFIETETDVPQIFYIWGHSYEFDVWETWGAFEEFCKYVANREDIYYGTNKDVLL